MKEDKLKTSSYAFALRIVAMSRYLNDQREYVLSKQVLRSETSIGANVTEARQAESKRDFLHKLAIANKEAFETEYWLNLLRDSSYISAIQAESLIADCNAPQRMLVSSLKILKSNN